ncbi:RNA polymerase sigma factor, partial [Rathayibacter sp. SD072]|uniref:RNA polymerase sigma factor n=1 Tax=Rathayibacter sp. SD072 TaxID=2781731 RepID=UPI001A95A125
MASTHRAQPSPRRRTARASAAPGDADLIALVREGDAAASAELWRRHASAARSLARAWSSLDADDLVSEAFLRTLDAIAKGGGPEGAFRPYLFTAVRNAAATGGRRSGREQPLDAIGGVAADDDGPEELALAALDRDLGIRAFRALPARWQEVLWYTAVEGMTPAEAAPLLGLRPNGVAALGHRAREGLRGEWIQQHVSVTAAEGECRWVLQQAGAHTRGRLALRDRRRADAHLEECPSCRGALAEAAGASARLAVALLPLVAGVGGATAYAAAGGAGGAPVAGTTGGAAAGTTGGAAAGAVTTGSASLVAAIAAAGVLLVAGIAVAALVPPGPTPGEQGFAAPASPVARADSGEDAVPPSPPTVASPPTVVSPPTVAVPPAPASTAPVPASTTTVTPPPIGAPPPSGT